MGQDTNNDILVQWMRTLDKNITELRKETLNALSNHEIREQADIAEIKRDIADLQAWKWRMIFILGTLMILGFISNDTIHTAYVFLLGVI